MGFVRTGQAVGVVLVLLGLATLYLLRDSLVALIAFIFEFILIAIGFILVFAGLALIFGRGMWASRMRN